VTLSLRSIKDLIEGLSRANVLTGAAETKTGRISSNWMAEWNQTNVLI
jgi:hypothetical protein